MAVHPRVCGEQAGKRGRRAIRSGSSPRVRGTAYQRQAEPDLSRFIPACAGNRTIDGTPSGSLTVHPRVCGEQSLGSKIDQRLTGSSPRVRGTAADARRERDWVRFIPACAGNSSVAYRTTSTIAVHPRVCGEQRPRRRLATVSRGSSPRVRGTAAVVPRRRPCFRFIPACAGNRARKVMV